MNGETLAFRLKADFLKALSHPVRLAVIERLRQGEAPVNSLCRDLGVEQPALSKHLGVLRGAGVVVARPEGTTVYYSIRDRDIFKLLGPIADILRRRLSESSRVLDRLARNR